MTKKCNHDSEPKLPRAIKKHEVTLICLVLITVAVVCLIVVDYKQDQKIEQLQRSALIIP